MEETKQEQAPEKAKPAKAAPLVTVRIIRENGPTALVEWAVKDDYRRAYVPKEVIHNLRVPADELDAGTPYGVRWEEFVVVTATPRTIGLELRKRGLWTVRDCESRVAEAHAAFVAACSADFGAMLAAARKSEEVQ